MAAGLGFKTFNTGEVLTSADVNGYLMQGVLVFASEAARNAAITSPQEGQFAYTKDNNSLWYYTGSAWAASGATGDIEGVTAGTGISGGGTSGTVTITNSMATAIDAKGDLVAGTGADAFARLGVGANGTLLTADSSEATGLKWAAPAGASGMTLITRQTISGSSGTNIDSVFTTTYKTYMIIFEDCDGSSGQADLYLQFRYGSTTMAQGYKYQEMLFSSTQTNTERNGINQIILTPNLGGSTSDSSAGQIMITRVAVSDYPMFWFDFTDTYSGIPISGRGLNNQQQTYTGIRVSPSTGTFDAKVAIYGLAA
jgi:hypothetical protein